jgi:hypothetical protein
VKKKTIRFVLIIIFIDIAICFSFFKIRSFPRLAIWNITESEKQSDFYWAPEDSPDFFHFEPTFPQLDFFKFQVYGLTKNLDSELEKNLIIARYVSNLSKIKNSSSKLLLWGSPYDILEQFKGGAYGTCFDYSILFSTYSASLGMKSRLWALEGDDGLNRFGHTVVEVYIKTLNKWVMIDISNELYFKEFNLPLSVLELRERLLNGKSANITIQNISSDYNYQKIISLYARLLKCVFLRTGNDFIYKYDSRIRFGRMYKLQRFFDKFPSEIRRGLSYLLGRRDYLMHYVDGFDKSMKNQIIVAKICFYFLPFSLLMIVLAICLNFQYISGSTRFTGHL